MEKSLIHSKKMAIRWGDMDAYGHVNNTNYFLYVQEARFEMMVEHGKKIDVSGIAPVLAETSCKFIRPITFPEIIIIETWLTNIEGKKTFFEHIIKSGTKSEVIYAVLPATIVWYDFANKTSVNTPEYIYNLLPLLQNNISESLLNSAVIKPTTA